MLEETTYRKAKLKKEQFIHMDQCVFLTAGPGPESTLAPSSYKGIQLGFLRKVSRDLSLLRIGSTRMSSKLPRASP